MLLWVPLLLVACAIAALSCARLCLAAVEAAARPAPPPEPERARALSLAEAAYLSGGPLRVADLTLLSMHRHRRLLLAHTGWVTVVDPRGRDPLERAVLGAIGPEEQCRTAPIRPLVAAADPVRVLADRLVANGLAVPDGGRRSVAGGVRAVRGALALALLLGAAALLTAPQADMASVLGWFTMPVVLTGGCLLIARMEVYPYTRWASPAGQALLGALPPDDPLAVVATRGVRALDDPELLAALTAGRGARPGH
ncbi:TIGR04222 domain-containing membrane protein [Streptomyces purpureus]|uniref:Membrane protein n=1 Tax=Streptomyces purpureus TaxID=1951 RepID=A0A918LMH4_9ACTN|nr:TIGR04222 domain-containing membrane protein [Streptomyces purpureus]GGT18639.1 membrane protein [Streptomyces purpureus]